MNAQATEIAEIISTRISHDLIGNIGAVGNAVELLEEGDMDFLDDIKSILKISSGVLNSRMKFFRMAFGLDNSNIEDEEQVNKISQFYIKTIGSGANNGISLTMNLAGKKLYREAMLTVMILVDTIIRGGEITISCDSNQLEAKLRSERELSAEKIATIQKIWENIYPENKAIYAAAIYLNERVKSRSYKIAQKEEEGFELNIQIRNEQ